VKLRGVYVESLGGVTFDESVRLEPVQIAGFNQAFRGVIETATGAVEAPVYKNIGVSLEGALLTRTWWNASFNVLTEDVDRDIGAFDLIAAPVFPHSLAILPSGTSERFDYCEAVYAVGINQLVGREFALNAGYRHTRAKLHRLSPQIPVTLTALADRRESATLHEVTLGANWNSPTGWFARGQADWYTQDVEQTLGTQPAVDVPADRFWHLAAQAGFRFHHNRREISAGVLNLTDRNYQLSPLTYTREAPRERTFFVRCRVRF
jgi:hypothetical protein